MVVCVVCIYKCARIQTLAKATLAPIPTATLFAIAWKIQSYWRCNDDSVKMRTLVKVQQERETTFPIICLYCTASLPLNSNLNHRFICRLVRKYKSRTKQLYDTLHNLIKNWTLNEIIMIFYKTIVLENLKNINIFKFSQNDVFYYKKINYGYQ